MRHSYETLRDPGQWGRAEVPTAMLMTPHDMFPTPRAWAERSDTIACRTEIDVGGQPADRDGTACPQKLAVSVTKKPLSAGSIWRRLSGASPQR